jgi:hypothetical protein
MDLLRYSDTVLTVCLKDKTRRETHDILRQIYEFPTRIHVCPCATTVWTRETLRFLGAYINNEPSHK